MIVHALHGIEAVESLHPFRGDMLHLLEFNHFPVRFSASERRCRAQKRDRGNQKSDPERGHGGAW